MQIKDMILGKKLEILVERGNYHYRLVSKVEGTVENSVAVSLIAAKGKVFHFEESDDVSIVYRGERMWKWDHVKTGLARLEGMAVHTFTSKAPGQIYNRREAFRVPIGERLLMYRISEEEDEYGEFEERKFPFEALLSDLSVNGAGLYSNEEMDYGTAISFDLPTHLGVLSCQGKINRKTDVYDKPMHFFYGCGFTVVRREMERYLVERQRLLLQKERGSESIRLRER